MLCRNLPTDQKNGYHFKKTLTLPEGNKLFAGDFAANLDVTNADMVQFTKRWNWRWIVNGRSQSKC